MSDAIAYPVAIPIPVWRRLGAFLALTKPRIAALVLATTAVGFCMAIAGSFGVGATLALFHTIIGVGLVAGGANALNQLIEVEFDRLMVRTQNRPLPAGMLTRAEALAFGAGLSVAGVIYLAWQVNSITGVLAALTSLVYLALYTPAKRLTPLSVHIGAVSGALPPLIGWSGCNGSLPLEAWTLFALLYFWQLPHFAAIAWQYREDYSRAGYPMLPVIDPQGMRLGAHVIHHTLGLLIASLLPAGIGIAGARYALIASTLGVAFLLSGVRFLRTRTAASARLHVVASICYLPVVLAAMVLDKLPR